MTSYFRSIDRGELYARTFQLLRHRISDSFAIPMKQLPRVLFHGGILALIIAGFWLLDSLKDPVLAGTVGIEYQPIAKLISVVATLVVVCVYDFFTSVVSKPALFNLVAGVFGFIIMVLSALLADPDLGLGNHRKGPHRVLGWISYCTIEAYGSLMVALFWSYTNSIMNLEQAKGAYGLIISMAQVGAIIGSTLATNASEIGISQLYLIGAILIFMVSLIMKTYHLTFKDYLTESVDHRVRSISEEVTVESAIAHTSTVKDAETNEMILLDGSALQSQKERKQAAEDAASCGATVSQHALATCGGCLSTSYRVVSGFWEGLSLLFLHPYMLKVLVVSCVYEVVVTILDYEFKILGARSAAHHIDSEIAQGVRFANLLGHFGQVTNLLSFFVSFFGFSYVVHHLGVSKSLLIFPVILFVAVVLINQVPSLMVLFVFVSIVKALIFSLHDPVKELLYIPTSEPIKFKAKAWIDVFGSRLAKAVGSLFTSMSGGNINTLRTYGEVPCLILAAFIIAIAFSVGGDFEKLVETDSIVGDDRPAHLRGGSHLKERIEEGVARRSGGGGGDGSGRKADVDGYDQHLFDGVFDEDEDEEEREDFRTSRNYSNMRTFEFPRMESVSSGNSKVERLRQLNKMAEAHHTYELPPLPPRGSKTPTGTTSSSSSSAGVKVSAASPAKGPTDSPSGKRVRAQSAQL